jgi:hypothetical protein
MKFMCNLSKFKPADVKEGEVVSSRNVLHGINKAGTTDS